MEWSSLDWLPIKKKDLPIAKKISKFEGLNGEIEKEKSKLEAQ